MIQNNLKTCIRINNYIIDDQSVGGGAIIVSVITIDSQP